MMSRNKQKAEQVQVIHLNNGARVLFGSGFAWPAKTEQADLLEVSMGFLKGRAGSPLESS